ncbi:MAG: hypothetical protein R3321_11345 [Nitrososphaeraceae archaeon]|nr:hypothetical protein [Nitrososphaeraceae archaeon]
MNIVLDTMNIKDVKHMTLLLSIVGSSFMITNSGNYINAQEDEDPLQIVSNIRNLLNQTMIEYKSENFTGASELVDIAYIDNYEYIEDPLKELNEDLMEETEVMIREDFSDAINDQAPIEDINAQYTQIQNNLDTIENLFSQN